MDDTGTDGRCRQVAIHQPGPFGQLQMNTAGVANTIAEVFRWHIRPRDETVEPRAGIGGRQAQLLGFLQNPTHSGKQRISFIGRGFLGERGR